VTTVSVIIPVFNGAATVGAALLSALDQRFDGEVDIIVVDDGSTDDTPAVLEPYSSNITVVRQSNRGLAAARNVGAARSRAAYLAFLDADDIWMEDKLARVIGRLETNQTSVLAYSDIIPVSMPGAPAGESPLTRDLAHAPSMEELLRRWWPILPSTVVMRRSAFQTCGGFCEQFRRAYEDVDMWLRARELGGFEFIDAPLVQYHVTPVHERMERYEADYAILRARLRERYGSGCRELLRASSRAYASSLGYRGLVAMHSGDRIAARRFFGRALRYGPANARNVLRWFRTLLPMRLAQALSGRSAKMEQSSAR
jgi:glycosyltransferase involved in cell wall biosynthesis